LVILKWKNIKKHWISEGNFPHYGHSHENWNLELKIDPLIIELEDDKLLYWITNRYTWKWRKMLWFLSKYAKIPHFGMTVGVCHPEEAYLYFVIEGSPTPSVILRECFLNDRRISSFVYKTDTLDKCHWQRKYLLKIPKFINWKQDFCCQSEHQGI